jgi:copper chaperone CopZ
MRITSDDRPLDIEVHFRVQTPEVSQRTRSPLMADHQPLVYIDLGVGGMTCDDCVVHVTEALESVPGVEDARVDLAARSAVVTARADVEGAALARAVRATGRYNAFERRRRPAADA